MAAVSWKGFLRLSLVSAPVVAVPAAASGGGEVHLHQLHAPCKSRIRYQKVCPIHGEVPGDEIVMAYEYEKGQYVIVDQAERQGLRTNREKTITIEKLAPPRGPRRFCAKREGRSAHDRAPDDWALRIVGTIRITGPPRRPPESAAGNCRLTIWSVGG